MYKNYVSLDLGDGETEDGPAAKKTTIVDSTLEKQIEVQTNEFFTIYDQLKSFNSGDNFLDLLSANNQFVPESFSDVRAHYPVDFCILYAT